MKTYILALVCGLCIVHGATTTVHAQQIHQDLQGIWKAKVVDVISETIENIPGTEHTHTIQTLSVELLAGDRSGQTVQFENDYLPLKEGDVFFMNYMITVNGDELYSVRDVDRSKALLFFVLLFAGVIILFGGKQGMRSLLSLCGTFLAIVYILLPLLLKGHSPILISSLIAAVILAFVIYLTHGFNRESHAAFLGTVIAVMVSSILAYIAITVTKLSGFSSDESVYLDLYTGGTLNFSGLLLGGIIMGALGVLDDISITQAAVVSELYSNNEENKKAPARVFLKALRVGREHVGALVNTLALAYAGAALPMLLLVSMSQIPFLTIINQELFATEIIRTIIGSIGLVLAVPTTTLLAVYFLKNAPPHSHNHSHHHGHTH